MNPDVPFCGFAVLVAPGGWYFVIVPLYDDA